MGLGDDDQVPGNSGGDTSCTDVLQEQETVQPFQQKTSDAALVSLARHQKMPGEHGPDQSEGVHHVQKERCRYLAEGWRRNKDVAVDEP